MSTDTNVQGAPTEPDDFIADLVAELGLKTQPATTDAKPSAEPPADAAETEEADAAGEGTNPEPEADAPETDDTEEPAADEVEETATEKAEDEDEQPEDEADADKAEAPTKVQQRIDKLVAQRHELTEQLDDLKAQLAAAQAQAEAKPPVVTLDPDNPLSSITDPSALETEIAKAQAVLDWCDENPDGGTVTVAGEERHYDADAVKQVRRNARELVRAAPRQKEYLEIRAQTLPEAKAFYPDFFKSGTTAHSFLQATLKQYPFITKIPGWELVVGDAFEGQRLRQARIDQMQKRSSTSKSPSAKAPAKTAPVAKAPAKPSASPKVPASNTALRQKAEAVFKARGEARNDALEQFMESLV